MSNFLINIAKKVLRIFKSIDRDFREDHGKYLNDVSGVVHVGANTGQEREVYDKFNVDVIWIEPIPDVFKQLQANIKGYTSQRAFQELVTDVDGGEYEFNIANNNGASSSIFNLKHHKDVWPDVDYSSKIKVKGTTLASLYERESIDPNKYQALVMDAQGAELLILKGCQPILEHFAYIKTEVADFESYAGGCELKDIVKFMEDNGFEEHYRFRFARRSQGGNYYDMIFKRA